jgi:diamine N-acetyltransferase
VLSFRLASSADSSLLADLGARLFHDTFAPSMDPVDMRNYLAGAFSPDIQAAQLADPTRAVWLAFDEDMAVGYTMLIRDSRHPSVVAERPVEAQRIYADQTWHGRGLGARLLDKCYEQGCEWQCDVLWLAVWQHNARAIAFYDKHGFTRVGTKTFQLGASLQHDHVMAKRLSS